MNPTDRNRLTTLLSRHVAAIAADLRAQMLTDGPVRDRAQKLHTDEQVGEDFDVWTDLLSRRAAVLWVLKSVYVRVLEDKGLLSPGRLFDPEAWQLFERLAPNLGETAFLRWVYRDLASERGGLPELFGPQPAEVAVPADALSRKLIAFWRARDPDTGHHWSFANERFDGELMGDLYQELDPTVKDRFALCQTPDFVREFILDRTLTPAIEEFGADTVRLLDPACGSGHFLIDGLKRLVEATAAVYPGWERGKVVRHALDRVVGIDLNDYACALARARLIMTAADLAGVSTLSEAAAFHPHVYWADGLEQVERGKDTRGQQLDLLDASKNEAPKASLSRPEVRAALRKVLAPKFHVVVANPPYIVETDESRRAYHREVVGGRRRYAAAYMQYHLSGPFIERSLLLACRNGFVGWITDNQFMKKEFGKTLIEDVLATIHLDLVMDTSNTHIPHHGTPTVIMLGRNCAASGSRVPAVASLRGGGASRESGGTMWSDLVTCAEHGHQTDGAREMAEYREVEEEVLRAHPWTFLDPAQHGFLSKLDAACAWKLGELAAEIGRTTACGNDDVYVVSAEQAEVLGLGALALPFFDGRAVRDWSASPTLVAVYPYEEDGMPAKVVEADRRIGAHFWKWRALLRSRTMFNKSIAEHGKAWFEHLEHYGARIGSDQRLSFASMATHNHVAICPGKTLHNSQSPVVCLNQDSPVDVYYLAAILSSSVACAWIKQRFPPRGATAANRNHPEPERAAYRITVTGMKEFPIIDERGSRLQSLGRAMCEVSSERSASLTSSDWISRCATASEVLAGLAEKWFNHDSARQRMIFLQEEIDWLVYHLLGLTTQCHQAGVEVDERIPRGQRAFERVRSHRSFVRERGRLLSPTEAEVDSQPCELSPQLCEVTRLREAEISNNPAIEHIESYMYKRLWRDTEENVREGAFREAHDNEQLVQWLTGRVEGWFTDRTRPATVENVSAALMSDATAAAVSEVIAGTQSYSLASILEAVVGQHSVPNHPFHTFTEDGLVVREAWEQVWELQRREDRGEHVGPIEPPPEYSQGSRGKPKHFLRNEYWKLRGKLDVPKERFIAFTEVPGRDGDETLYGWAGWTPIQRIRVLLSIDEDLEDDSVPLADRIGLLDSAWRLLPDAEREDAARASRLRAELRSIIGGDGFSKEQLADWKARFPPPAKKRNSRSRKRK